VIENKIPPLRIDIGLPKIEFPAALLFFYVGIEIGQVLFVAILIGVVAGLRALNLISTNHAIETGDVVPLQFYLANS